MCFVRIVEYVSIDEAFGSVELQHLVLRLFPFDKEMTMGLITIARRLHHPEYPMVRMFVGRFQLYCFSFLLGGYHT